MDRPLKSPLQLIREGYDSEAALVFLGNFFEEEKNKQVHTLMTCPEKDLALHRGMYKYVCGLEKLLKQKVEIGIKYATEQPREEDSEGGNN